MPLKLGDHQHYHALSSIQLGIVAAKLTLVASHPIRLAQPVSDLRLIAAGRSSPGMQWCSGARVILQSVPIDRRDAACCCIVKVVVRFYNLDPVVYSCLVLKTCWSGTARLESGHKTCQLRSVIAELATRLEHADRQVLRTWLLQMTS